MKSFKEFVSELKTPTGELKKACWKGYTAIGTKKKNGKIVPNCVPKNESIEESQEHTSADTSLNQISAGLKHAVSKGLIKPNSINVDNGGGKYDAGKNHVESSIEGAKLSVHDPFNRSEKHNTKVKTETFGNSDYVGLHNVLNVIKEPEERKNALETVKGFMKPKSGIAHITVYEGDKSGNSRVTKKGWQEHRPTSSYENEVRDVFPEKTHEVSRKGAHIIVKQK